jgi:hypothetical protein
MCGCRSDFVIGVPLAFKRGPLSGRLRLWQFDF